MDHIDIQGARTHNLKDVNLTLPRDKFIVITGLSGSGKSSLAFDTLYAEGQRRYVESLSAYARQFLSVMSKPDVDHIEGLSPAISIEQKTTSHNPRSTVGTVTEIYDYLRLLYARAGIPHCPTHALPLLAQPISQMVDKALSEDEGTKLVILSPVVRERKGEHINLIDSLKAQGYARLRINGTIYDISEAPKLDLRKKHTIDVVIDRVKAKPDLRNRLADSFETALALSDGLAILWNLDTETETLFSSKYACPECGYSLTELEPRLFSFNNPVGACPTCDGLGVTQYFDPEKVIHDDELSLAQGAARGWDRRSPYYFSMLQSLASYYQFDIDTPFKELPKKIQNVILNGSDGEVIPFTFFSERSGTRKKKQAFEGVIPNLDRRYHETDSDYIRDELSQYLTQKACQSCNGSRLRESARHVWVGEKTLPEVSTMAIGEAKQYFSELTLEGHRQEIASKIVKEIALRLSFLNDVGLDYLSLERTADTLSGGEAQRIRLASQIGAGLVGVMYILDEPSIGLHQRDNERLLESLMHLKSLGNTVIVIEHDEDAIRNADFVVDIGPGAGVHGGSVVAAGTPKEVSNNKESITGRYLSGLESIAVPKNRTPVDPKRLLKIQQATGNNLQSVSVEIPLGLMTCVTGVSGSGKSTLINDTLYPLAAHHLNRAMLNSHSPCKAIKGLEQLDKVVCIDQSPIGRTPRSNPATYTGIFTHIRELFAMTNEAKSRGYKTGRFSFNVKGGRCETCQGDGLIKVEMHFLADIYVECDTCKGKRYNEETLQIHYKGKNIYDVLEMTIEDAAEFFSAIPPISKKLELLKDVGLSYIKLGQAATTLSGGEAQRIKLAKELSRRDTGSTLYILDEPTTGLHFHDVKQLLAVLDTLKGRGNTLVIIEHNLDVVKTADWIIDLGPEGGSRGGEIVAVGTPEEVSQVKGSHTGRFLKEMV